jgi:ankyrin repeat protein
VNSWQLSRLRRLANSIVKVVLATGLLATHAFALDARAQDLWAFMQAGDLQKVQTYLATPGVDINDRYVVGGVYDDPNLLMDDKSLLDLAVEAKQLAIVTYLLDHGAQVNAIQQQGLDEGVTALHRAAFFDSAEIVELLIARGANVNAKHGTRANGTGGATPLLYAATNGSLNAISSLLKHGADATAGSVGKEFPLETATKDKHPEAAQLIKDYLDKPPAVDILDAARIGDLEAVRRALTPDIDRATLGRALRLVLIAGMDRFEERQGIVQLLIHRGARAASVIDLVNTPATAQWIISKGARATLRTRPTAPTLAVACNPVVQDRAAVLKVLVDSGVRIAADPVAARTMLRCAVRAHDLLLAEYLLTQGAKAYGRDAGGRTLLFDAPDAAMVDLLIQHGARVTTPDSTGGTAVANAIVGRRTPVAVELIVKGALQGAPQPLLLHTAARTGETSVIKALLDHGAPIEARDADGRTGLHWAVYARDYSGVATLVDRGADINATDNIGWSVLHVAASRSVPPHLLSYLLEHHANTNLRDKQGRLAKDLASDDALRDRLKARPVAWDQPLSAQDAAACAEVVRRTGDASLGQSVVFGEPPSAPRDTEDNWSFLNEVPTRIQLSLSSRTYILGSDSGPVYLSQIREDGVEGVVCEFSALSDSSGTNYRVLGSGERLPGDLTTLKPR